MNLGEVNRILVICLGGIGDVLVATPTLRTLKAAFPRADLTCITQVDVKDILLNNPDIDELIIYDSKSILRREARQPEYDLAIHLMGGFDAISLVSGAKYRVGRYKIKIGHFYPYNVHADVSTAVDVIDHFLNFTRALGLKDTSRETYLFLTSAEINFADSFWEDSGLTKDERVVGLHPGGADVQRLWAIKNYARVADELIARTGCRILIFQGPDEMETAASVRREMHNQGLLVPLLQIRQYAALVKKCHLLITSDGGPLHLAAAVGVNLLGIFQDELSAKRWFPYRDKKNCFHLVKSSSTNISLVEVANAALKLISSYK
jgi:ADP-heptose:LPS heptosyltransferase